ncbi:MAG: helix-turn-helix domain-containing protein [Firmicutes bacterium]|nr:helix-turn-helix domain-containing protein [Bacillota bacterium]
MMYSTFAERLKELRTECNLSHAQLAKQTGISAGAIGLWELNRREAKIDAVITLAKFFNVSVGYMVGTED